MCRVTTLQSDARLPPEQNGPAERQQRAGRTISSSYVQASTSQPSKLPFHFVLFCSPVENMLSRAATGQKSTPPSIIMCTITMVRMFQFTMQPTTAQTMTFHEELKKKKHLCFCLEGKIWTRLPDTKLTCTERVCWQVDISVCLIYSSPEIQNLDGSSCKLNYSFLLFNRCVSVAQQFHIRVKCIISSLSCIVTLYCLKLQPQMKSSWLH